MLVKTFSQPVYEEIKYYWNQQNNKQYLVVSTEDEKNTQLQQIKDQKKGGLSSFIDSKNIEILQPVNTDFSIVIPKIGANAPIIANVDAGSEEVYLDALSKGVAHASGTAYPGEGGHIFIFAHSTDYVWNVSTYNAVFYLLYKLEGNDEINLFYKGKRYKYKVIGRKVIDPSRVEYLTRKTPNEFLTMQTCWPPGTTLQRLLIFATLKVN